MTLPLNPTPLTRLRNLVASRWGACAEAQGIKQISRANVGDDGNLYITVPELRMHRQSTLDAFARATESLSRIIEDEGYDVERGERDGRPTWRVVGLAGEAERTPGTREYDTRNGVLWDERRWRDEPRHAAASDPRGPKYQHAVNVERSRR